MKRSLKLKITKPVIRQLTVLATLAILSACQSTPPGPVTPGAISRPLEPIVGVAPVGKEISGQHNQSQYNDLDLINSYDDFRLQQADEMIRTGQPGLALALLKKIDIDLLPPDQQTRTRILIAVTLLQAGGSEQAENVLKGSVTNTQPATLSAFYLLRAEAAMRQGQLGLTAKALSKRTVYLNTEQSLQNQSMIWHNLINADRQQLTQLKQQNISAALSGWTDLALRVMSSKNPSEKMRTINNWRISHLAHPANPILLDQILEEASSTRRPQRIAFLLPLTSPYAPAATAVRDGFEATNNEQPVNNRFSARFYDYGRDPEAAVLYYNQAVADGADIIIGPLGRKSIDGLLANSSLQIPTILLSTPTNSELPSNPNLFQFSLSQELESQQAAERAWLDGHRQGVILSVETDTGQHNADAFSQRFRELGGTIASYGVYASRETDYSPVVRRLLGVDSSERRVAEMKKILGQPVTSEARRRQDIDFIFLPAKNSNARLIKPVLDFFYALNLPVYSTSLVFSGAADPINDRDLDRIQFPDMPWMIASNIELDSLRTFRQGGWANRGTSYNRLYGLGMDLFSLLPRLKTMRDYSYLHYAGLSGILNIDSEGVVNRHLLWAKFSKGTPGLIDKSTTYQGRFSEKKYKATPAGTPTTRQ